MKNRIKYILRMLIGCTTGFLIANTGFNLFIQISIIIVLSVAAVVLIYMETEGGTNEND